MKIRAALKRDLYRQTTPQVATARDKADIVLERSGESYGK
jgi:hypothetical protein